ncbi:MAG TPA: hypothetical protein VH762_03295 [Gemmatimonadaceae bacterium]|jgi:hypothetical protein
MACGQFDVKKPQFLWTGQGSKFNPTHADDPLSRRTRRFSAARLAALPLAYVAFALLGLLYFPAKQGFDLAPTACETLPSARLSFYSLQNYPHIVMFSFFFVLSYIQFREWGPRARFAWAALATLTMGALVELAEGISGLGHCRVRDLIPDAAGVLLGATYVLSWDLLRKALSHRLAR